MPVFALYNLDDADTLAVDSAVGNGAQNGLYLNGAASVGGQAVLDGVDDFVKIFPDPTFQMDRGTLEIQFTTGEGALDAPQTVLSRDSTGVTEGGYRIQIMPDGSVQILHEDTSGNVSFGTPAGFFAPGDELNVTYSWDENGVGQLQITNLTQGTSFDEPVPEGLTMDMSANGQNQPWIIGAGQANSDPYVLNNIDQHFQGTVEFFSLSDTVDNLGAPDANPDTAETDEDTPVVIDVLGNDTDPNGDPLTIVGVPTAGNGTVTVNPDGTISYTPDPDFNGTDTITYTITDPDGNEASSTVTVTVNPVNDAPVAEDDASTTPLDTPVTFAVLGNDSDVDGDPLSVLSVGTTPDGTVALNGDGTLTFTPNAGFTGTTSVEYTITDPEGLTDTAVWTITVTDDAQTPVANPDTAETDEDTPVVIDVLGNDTDPNGDPLTIVGVPTAGNGTVTVNPDGTISYTPDPDFNGTDTITYTITDPDGNEASSTVTVTVNPVNDAPVAEDDASTTPLDTPVTFAVLGNDSDVDGDPLSVLSVGTTPDGTVALNGDGTLTFTPNAGFTGTTSVEYTITDPEGLTDTAVWTITVNPGPDGIVEGTPGDDLIDLDYAGDPEGDFIDNDDALLPGETGNDDLVEAGAGNDTIFSLDGDDEVNADEGDDVVDAGVGNDFVDGGDGNDDILGGEGDDSLYGSEGDDTIDGGEGNDEIVGGLGDDEVTGGAGDDTLQGNEGADVITGGDGNDDALGGDGNDLIDTSGTDSSPDRDYPGLYTADTDPEDDRDSVIAGTGDDTVYTGDDRDTILGGSGNDLIYAGVDDDSVTAGGENDTVIGGEGNDTITGDLGDDLIYGGEEPGAADPTNLPDDGTDLDESNNEDSLFGGLGNDTIYGGDDDDTISGGLDDDLLYGGLDEDEVNGNAGDDTVYGDEGNDTVAGDLGNDLVYGGAGDDSVLGGTENDSLFGDEGNDTLIGGFGQDSLEGGEGDDSVEGGIDNDTLIGGEGADTLVGGADRDTFIGGDIGEFVDGSETGDDFDTLDLRGVGSPISVVYDADNIENGTVTFLDPTGAPTGTMRFENIENVLSDAPVANPDTAETDEDTPVTIDVLGNDTDPNGDPLEIVGTPTADNGTVTVNPDGTLEYTPDPDFNGTDTITYTITDPDGNRATTTVTVTVNPVNDPPVAEDDASTTPYNTAVTAAVLANDSDPDGDTLTVVGTPTSADGTVTVNPDGTLTFTPNPGFTGVATVSYTVTDPDGLTDDAVWSITVEEPPRDGYVDGTPGDDLIDATYDGDPDGDFVDNDDAILPGDEPNDDRIRAGDGNDTILAGEGDDTVTAGNGNDSVDGGDGDDVIGGGRGNDTVDGGDGRDVVYGGAGQDVIDTSGGIPLPNRDYPGLYPADTAPTDDEDTVYGSGGGDTITTGDDNDVIFGGGGADVIDGGIDDDTIDGGRGSDTIIGGEGADLIDGGDHGDLIYGGLDPSFPDELNIPDATDLRPDNGTDTIYGGAGDDTIFGMDDDDVIDGGDGNDLLDGGIDEDTITGGANNDTIIGGQGADSMAGGDDRDTFIIEAPEDGFGDVIDGNEGGDDFDTLDLRGAGPLRVNYDPTNIENGTVDFLDADGNVSGSLTFTNIENVIIPCFTPGTLIATPRGEVPVESLRPGDRVITRDNGIQEIRWTGQKAMTWRDLTANPHMKPILIRQGSLGNGLPERDMMVSPNHRVLVANDRTALYFDEHEVLVSAKHLVAGRGVQEVDSVGTTYIHFMFDRHEVVLSNGAWTESFQPGDYTLKGMGNAQRNEIFELFPELKTQQGLEGYSAARKTLKKHEAKLLIK